ncbi:MAG TPA: hypothetical protein VE593_04845 [Nitrososphaeraceae archaeon]|nr:hypothetical protein [Nitrososphaeraceae archaeon]
MNSRQASLILGIAIALTIGISIMFTSPLSATTNMGGDMIVNNPPPSSPQQSGAIPASNNILPPGLYARGTIASVQNDKDGKPEWIVSGLWRGSLTNLTSGAEMMSSSGANSTTSKNNLPSATFSSVFDMVMLNGSALHNHQISNFTLTGMSMPDKKTVLYNGTATITMKDGPVNDVPISVRTLNDNVISIWVDPAKTMNHFGNTPIYGTITQDVLIRK